MACQVRAISGALSNEYQNIEKTNTLYRLPFQWHFQQWSCRHLLGSLWQLQGQPNEFTMKIPTSNSQYVSFTFVEWTHKSVAVKEAKLPPKAPKGVLLAATTNTLGNGISVSTKGKEWILSSIRRTHKETIHTPLTTKKKQRKKTQETLLYFLDNYSRIYEKKKLFQTFILLIFHNIHPNSLIFGTCELEIRFQSRVDNNFKLVFSSLKRDLIP